MSSAEFPPSDSSRKAANPRKGMMMPTTEKATSQNAEVTPLAPPAWASNATASAAMNCTAMNGVTNIVARMP
jgi:hypothetical protein